MSGEPTWHFMYVILTMEVHQPPMYVSLTRNLFNIPFPNKSEPCLKQCGDVQKILLKNNQFVIF